MLKYFIKHFKVLDFDFLYVKSYLDKVFMSQIFKSCFFTRLFFIKTKYLFIFCFLVLCAVRVSAQTDTSGLISISNSLSKYSANYPPEKVYLHLDRPYYNPGDTIWFKAYTVLGEKHKLSALSGVLYVELINPKDSLVIRQTLHLNAGLAWSDISLSNQLRGGEYRLRAYTNWMRNFGDSSFYDHHITINGPQLKVAVLQGTQNTDVQFFPEGGDLVAGVRSRVAIKAINSSGLGTDVSGVISDNDGVEVAAFSTVHLGVGVFALTPQPLKTYTAKLTANNITWNVALPAIKPEGYVFSIFHSQNDTVNIKIAVNQTTLSSALHNSAFFVVGQSAGKVYFTSQGRLNNLVYTLKVNKNRFPSGVATFTLFNANKLPVNERLVFFKNADTATIKSSFTDKSYQTREAVNLNVTVINGNNPPAAGSYSIAVTNESKAGVDDAGENTIFSDLLLTSDLKGYVEQPNYYFSTNNPETANALDILMLTQGYRRYNWTQIINNSQPQFNFKPEKSLSLQGLLKTPSGKPVPNGKITLVATKQNLLIDTVANANGEFIFSNLYLPDTTKLVLKARKQNNGTNVSIYTKERNYPKILPGFKTVKYSLNLSPEMVANMRKDFDENRKNLREDSLKNGVQLSTVHIRASKNQTPRLTHSANLFGAGNADQVIMGTKLDGCITISDCLQGKVFGVGFEQDGSPYNLRNHKTMSIIIDGLPLDGNQLNNQVANNIYSIEVLRSSFYRSIYGSSIDAGGALVITTKIGSGDETYIPSVESAGLITSSFSGFYTAKSFYTPGYAVANAGFPVLRSIIYWNPDITTDEEGKALIHYFNNDTKGTYRIVIEGIDNNGYLARKVYRYKVN